MSAHKDDKRIEPFISPINICELSLDIAIVETSEPVELLIIIGFLLSSISANKTDPSVKPVKTAFSPLSALTNVASSLPPFATTIGFLPLVLLYHQMAKTASLDPDVTKYGVSPTQVKLFIFDG